MSTAKRVQDGRVSLVFFALIALQAVTMPTNANAQSCTLETPAGILVTEMRGSSGSSMVATPQGIAVTWRETNPSRTGGFNSVPTVLLSRTLDARSLAPRGAAVRIFAEPGGQTSTPGSLAAFADGRVILNGCTCTGRTGATSCSSTTLLGTGNIAALQVSATGRGDCIGPSISSTVLGSDLLLTVSSGPRGRALWLGTAVTPQPAIAEPVSSGSVRLSAVSPTQALYVRQVGEDVVGRWVNAAGASPGGWTRLSTARMSTSLPQVTGVNGAAITVWAERAMDGWNFRPHLSTWQPGQQPVNQLLDLGPAPGVPLSITSVGAPGATACALLAWREGSATGQPTVSKVGRVCSGVVVPTSVITLAQTQADASNPVVAASRDTAYVLWTVHGDRPFAEQELRVSRVVCR